MLVMAQWDDNNDGVITREEFKKGLSNYGMSVLMGSEVDSIFQAVDVNEDGVIEYSELEDYIKNEWRAIGDEDVSNADVRRQYAQNRALMANKQKKRDARKLRQQLAEAKAARERVLKDGNAGINLELRHHGLDSGAEDAVAASGEGDRIAAEARVRHYLLNMRSKQDEKWRSARARDVQIAKKLESQVLFKTLPKAARLYAASRMSSYKLKPGETVFKKVSL
jgi:hypothetical protein